VSRAPADVSSPRAGPAPAWWLAALAALALVGLFAASLGAELYGEVVAAQRVGGVHRASTLHAATLAQQLAPRKAEARRVLALALSARDADAEARSQAGRALRWAPAEGESWRVLARVLAHGGEFGPPLGAALQGATRQAPYSMDVHLSLALDGVAYWTSGDDRARALWLRSIRLLTHRRWSQFMRQITLARGENAFCHHAGEQLKLRQWCNKVGEYRLGCSRRDLKPQQRTWCDQLGFRLPAAP
jgi:hypothetical protein